MQYVVRIGKPRGFCNLFYRDIFVKKNHEKNRGENCAKIVEKFVYKIAEKLCKNLCEIVQKNYVKNQENFLHKSFHNFYVKIVERFV